MIDYHWCEGDEAPLDSYATFEHEPQLVMYYDTPHACAAWVRMTTPFCCVGTRADARVMLSGRLPHNVELSDKLHALCHLVKTTTQNIHGTSRVMEKMWQCVDCYASLD